MSSSGREIQASGLREFGVFETQRITLDIRADLNASARSLPT